MSHDAPIAIVSTYYPPVVGGVETSASGIAHFLARRGHRVQVFTKQPSTEVPADEVIDGVTIHRLPPVGLRRASGKWRVLPAMQTALVRATPAPALIYCVDYRGIGLGALSAGRALRVPVIFQAGTDGVLGPSASVETTRGMLTRLMHRLARLPLRRRYRRADCFICISRDIERETLAAGVPRERVMYLPHPVKCTDFAPVDPATRTALRAELSLNDSEIVAVSVGRLSREKGTLNLAAAWRQANPAARLIFIGPDEPGHPWDAGAPARAIVGVGSPGSSGPARAARFEGAVPPERVAKFLRAADFAIQPPHFEAFGIAALEAMAAGLPVIATSVGGLRDFVRDDVNGVLVPPQAPDALAAAIGRVVGDAALRQRLGAGALATAARFDEDAILGQLAELIESMAGR